MKIVCSECGCSIVSKKDLFVSVNFIMPIQYCSKCWATTQKSFFGQMIVGIPLNGSYYNLISTLAAVIIPFLFFYENYELLALCLVALSLRFVSYWLYERWL